MDDRFAGFPRRRVIWGQYFMSFSWSLGLWAAVPVVPILSLQLVDNIALAGLVVSIGGAGRFFVSYITGAMLDRFGRRGVGALGIFIRMVFSFLEGISPTYFALVAFRFGSGIGTSIWGTAHQTITADVSTAEDRGRISGRKQGWMHFGAIVGPVVGGRGLGDNGRHPGAVLHQRVQQDGVPHRDALHHGGDAAPVGTHRSGSCGSSGADRTAARPAMARSTSYLSGFYIRVGMAAVRLAGTAVGDSVHGGEGVPLRAHRDVRGEPDACDGAGHDAADLRGGRGWGWRSPTWAS